MKAVIQPGKTWKWVTGIDDGSEYLKSVEVHNTTFFAMRRLRKLTRDVEKVERLTRPIADDRNGLELKP